jgi:hypothetical protein
MMSFNSGDCFLIQNYVDQDGNPNFHLFLVILDPLSFNNRTIIVSFSTIRGGREFDNTTIIHPGEGVPEFINKPSYVNYRLSRIVSTEELDAKLENGELINKEYEFCETVFQEICLGIDRSGFTPRGVKRLYHESIYQQLD